MGKAMSRPQHQQHGGGDQENRAIAVQQNYKSIAQFFSQDNVKSQIARALPRHMSAERMARVALIAISKNYKLMQCTPESLAKALTECSSYGLEPNGRDIHLVPFWNSKKKAFEVQVIPDYKGLVQLMYRSGMVINVMPQAVRRKDEFDYKFGSGAFVTHRPADDDDRGPLTYAWAMAQLKGGGEPFVVLNKSQVTEHMKASRGSDAEDSPWKTHPDAMWAKTALRVLAKFVPMSSEVLEAFHRDEEANTVEGEAILAAAAEEPQYQSSAKSKSERLNDSVEDQVKGPAAGEIVDEEGEGEDESENDGEPTQSSNHTQLKTGAGAEFLEMMPTAKTIRDWSRLRDHFLGPESDFQVSDEERAEINRICDEETQKLQKAKQQKTLA